MKKFQLTSVLALLCLCSSAFAQNTKTDRAIKAVKELCLTGTQFDLKADAKGNLTLRKLLPGGEGSVSVNVRESSGAAAIFDEKIRQIADEDIRRCIQPHIEKIIDAILGALPDLRRQSSKVPGWSATFSTKEAGGGSFRSFPLCTTLVNTLAAIDINSSLPPGLSHRNVFIEMTATTDHQVSDDDEGRWGYYIKVVNASSSPYTQCTTFEVKSDGVPIGGGALPILQGATSNTSKPMEADQMAGMHTLTIKLACYFQGGQFPVVSLQVKPPRGQWRLPVANEFTVEKLVNPNVPLGEQSRCF